MSDGYIEPRALDSGPSSDVGDGDGSPVGAVEQPVKRGRGRPRKSDSGGTEYVDPAALGGGNSGGSGDASGDTGNTGTRRRGRPRKAAQAVPISVDTLLVALAAVQVTAFKLTEVQECVLSADQNKALADALAKVSRHYPMAISEKAADFTALAVVAGNICFTQYALYSRRTNAARQQGGQLGGMN